MGGSDHQQRRRPRFLPNTSFATLPGEHHLLAAITMPSEASPYVHAATLPVLVKPMAAPASSRSCSVHRFYWDAQWWADQGYIVLTADGRGTTGRGPKWDREMFEDMKGVSLADQIEAVKALPQLDWENGPKPDLDKVAIIGWSFGGFLSALAVLDAPNVFHAACAGAPPTDWTLYDTHYTERYLGLDPAVYERQLHHRRRAASPARSAHPRFCGRQRHHRTQPAVESGADGGRS